MEAKNEEIEVRRRFYRDKVMLAPMVRVGTLPMRLLALQYGADVVYCEEIIDFKILNAHKVENKLIGTTDFVLSDETVVFRTCRKEKKKLIFQLGTSDAKRALKAAQKIQDYVAGVDINMGCPKEFSIKGGMGAALLTQPEKVKEILTTLVNGLHIPVTCKIRLLPNMNDMLALVKLIESTGVSALGVHGRYKEERPRHPNRNHVIKEITQHISIPVIANGGSGEIKNFPDIEVFREAAGASSVMIARAAQWNPSIFRPEGRLPLNTVVREYIKLAVEYDNNCINTKYCILQMMHADMESIEGQKTLATTSMKDICEIWRHSGYYEAMQKYYEARKKKLNLTNENKDDLQIRESDDGIITINMPLRYHKNDFPSKVSPKQRLFEWLRRTEQGKPLYETTERKEDRNFNSVMTLSGKVKFTTPFWEKSKQLAEQASATVATTILEIPDGRVTEPTGQLDDCKIKWRQFLSEKKSGCELAVQIFKKLKCDHLHKQYLEEDTEASSSTKRKINDNENDMQNPKEMKRS